jgi:hypothetical protein
MAKQKPRPPGNQPDRQLKASLQCKTHHDDAGDDKEPLAVHLECLVLDEDGDLQLSHGLEAHAAAKGTHHETANQKDGKVQVSGNSLASISYQES